DYFQALVHLNSHNLAHLDIKEGNIMRTKEGLYKLGDFSVTADLTNMEKKDIEFGEGMYAAPEVLQHIITVKADIYSLGVALALISLPVDAPLTEKESTEIKTGQLPERVTNALTGPLGLNKLVESMLDLDFSSRPSAQDFIEN
ncbi:hypothetical protein PFISCL1PPCAC_7571, partial [Pristionchus fissidentatus]